MAWLAKDGGAALAAVVGQEEEKVLAVAGNCCAAALLPEGGALGPVRANQHHVVHLRKHLRLLGVSRLSAWWARCCGAGWGPAASRRR